MNETVKAGNTQAEWAIIKILNRYGIAMDTRRWDLFDTIFTSDVELEYPRAGWRDLATFKTDFALAHERFDATQHAMMNHLVEVDGDTASAFTYCAWRLICRGTTDDDVLGNNSVEGTAWYDDSLILTADGWRIKRRACRILWADGNPAATGATSALPWDILREEAARGEVCYLQAYDAKRSS